MRDRRNVPTLSDRPVPTRLTASRSLLLRLLRLGIAVSLVAATAAASAAETGHLRLGADEWPPFTAGPGAERAALDLVHAALDRAEIAAETTISEWKAVQEGIRRGDLDGSPAMWRSNRRQQELVFSQPYLENRLVLVGLSGSDVSARRLTELAGRRVAVVGNHAYGDVVDAAVGVLFVGARDDQDSLDRLIAGEVDFMLVDELVVRHLLDFQPEEVEANLEIGMAPLAKRPLHLALRRDVAGAERIIAAFDREIRAMQGDGSYAEILNVGCIRVDVDGDGLYELVPFGETVDEALPGRVYDVFGKPVDETPPEKQRIVIRGSIYEGWDAIPEHFKAQGPAGIMDATFKHGTTVMTLKF